MGIQNDCWKVAMKTERVAGRKKNGTASKQNRSARRQSNKNEKWDDEEAKAFERHWLFLSSMMNAYYKCRSAHFLSAKLRNNRESCCCRCHYATMTSRMYRFAHFFPIRRRRLRAITSTATATHFLSTIALMPCNQVYRVNFLAMFLHNNNAACFNPRHLMIWCCWYGSEYGTTN